MDHRSSGRSGHHSVLSTHARAFVLSLVALSPSAVAGDGAPRVPSGALPSHFLAPSTAARIVLPGHAMAATADEARAELRERALIERAEAEAAAAAEVRRRAEDLSRRFIGDAEVAAVTPRAFMTTSIAPLSVVPAAAPASIDPASVAPVGPDPAASEAALPAVNVLIMPVQPELSPDMASPAAPQLIAEPEKSDSAGTDALARALRQVAAAEARAAAERRARLAAEAEAKAAVERALDALARADRATKAATRRATQAEQRATSATASKSASARRDAGAAAKRSAPPPPPPKSESSPSLLSRIFGGSKSSQQPPLPPFALGVVQSIQN